MSLPHTILIVEEDPSIRRLLRTTLKGSGHRVIEAATGRDGQLSAAKNNPTVIILDRQLSDIDGIQLISYLRQLSDAPILVLSDDGGDALPAIDAFADDFITIPFSKEELIVRVNKAILRTAPTQSQNALFRLDDLEVDFMANRVFLHGTETHLTPIEFKLLTFLIKNCGKVLSPEFILRGVWGPGHENDKKCLRTFIYELRRKVEDVPARPKHLVTEVGVGYRLKMA